jgi:hypothetical protein
MQAAAARERGERRYSMTMRFHWRRDLLPIVARRRREPGRFKP